MLRNLIKEDRQVIPREVAVDVLNFSRFFWSWNFPHFCRGLISLLDPPSLRVFLYFWRNICNLACVFLISAWRCRYTAAFLCCFPSYISDFKTSLIIVYFFLSLCHFKVKGNAPAVFPCRRCLLQAAMKQQLTKSIPIPLVWDFQR